MTCHPGAAATVMRSGPGPHGPLERRLLRADPAGPPYSGAGSSIARVRHDASIAAVSREGRGWLAAHRLSSHGRRRDRPLDVDPAPSARRLASTRSSACARPPATPGWTPSRLAARDAGSRTDASVSSMSGPAAPRGPRIAGDDRGASGGRPGGFRRRVAADAVRSASASRSIGSTPRDLVRARSVLAGGASNARSPSRPTATSPRGRTFALSGRAWSPTEASSADFLAETL